MVVNTSKTELIILAKNMENVTINIGGEEIKSRKSIKVTMPKKIGKNLNIDQFLKLARFSLFSVIYYARTVE